MTATGWPVTGTSLVGPTGPAGTFSGQLTSPDGRYSLSITDGGIVLSGPAGSATINAAGITVASTGTVKVTGGELQLKGLAQIQAQSGSALSLTAGGILDLNGNAVTQIHGENILLNGGCAAMARVGDTVFGPGGTVATIQTGSPSVLSC
jgi:hypothetical protein